MIIALCLLDPSVAFPFLLLVMAAKGRFFVPEKSGERGKEKTQGIEADNTENTDIN